VHQGDGRQPVDADLLIGAARTSGGAACRLSQKSDSRVADEMYRAVGATSKLVYIRA
jgi:hypothetical protein